MGSNSRFLTLDAMRGVAALMVVLYHARPLGRIDVESGYLAVDFFFMLSGFVVARAYGNKLDRGMSSVEFMGIRAIRLLPCMLVGLALSTLYQLWLVYSKPDASMPLVDILTSAVAGAMFLPAPLTSYISPLNYPAWSLILEMGINVVFALRAYRTTAVALPAMVCTFCALIYASGLEGGIDKGWTWSEIWVGLARVGFSFSAGVLLEKVNIPRRKASWPVLPLFICLAALLAARPSAEHRALFQLGFILVASPILLWIGAQYEPAPALKKICGLLGELSYPLYATHFTLLFVITKLQSRGVPDAVTAAVGLTFFMVFAWLTLKFIDQPARRLLMGRLKRRQFTTTTSNSGVFGNAP